MSADDWIHYLSAFLAWASDKRRGKELEGDLLARLSKDLNCWLCCESVGNERLLSLMGDGVSPPALRPTPEVQGRVLDWLKSQPVLAGDGFDVARWQLVSCPAFERWEMLEDAQELKFKVRGVWGVVLNTAGVGEVRRMFAIFVPKTAQGTEVEVLPLNFICEDAAALSNAGQAVEYLLTKQAPALLRRYLWSGEPLHRSFRYFLRVRQLLPLMEKTLKLNRVFIYMDSPPGQRLRGASVGAAAAVAILEALLYQAEEDIPLRSSDAFVKSLWAGLSAELADVCITGAVGSTGHLSSVEGVDPPKGKPVGPKMRAMVGHDEIFRAVVPLQNLRDEAAAKRIKLREICRADTLHDLVFWLQPLRRRWKVLNVCAVAAVSFFLILVMAVAPDLLDRARRQPRLLAVVVDDQTYSYDYTLLNRVPISPIQKLALRLGDEPGDGWTEAEISVSRESGTRTRDQRLKAVGESEEWHQALRLTPDGNGMVEFEYQHGLSEEGGAVLLVTILRKGRLLDRGGRAVRLLSIRVKNHPASGG